METDSSSLPAIAESAADSHCPSVIDSQNRRQLLSEIGIATGAVDEHSTDDAPEVLSGGKRFCAQEGLFRRTQS